MSHHCHAGGEHNSAKASLLPDGIDSKADSHHDDASAHSLPGLGSQSSLPMAAPANGSVVPESERQGTEVDGQASADCKAEAASTNASDAEVPQHGSGGSGDGTEAGDSGHSSAAFEAAARKAGASGLLCLQVIASVTPTRGCALCQLTN
jgi:hypothetical protein